MAEARGILYAIASCMEDRETRLPALRFLIQVGHEDDRERLGLWEPDIGLRATARKVLLGQIRNTPPQKSPLSDLDILEAQLCAGFFATDRKHCSFVGRDKGILQRYLERIWGLRTFIDTRISDERARLRALVNADDYGFLVDRQLIAAVPELYNQLIAKMGRALDHAPVRMTPVAEDVSADDIPLEVVVWICGEALIVFNRDCGLEHAKALLQLRAIAEAAKG
jgi:hypothetical protein